MKSRILIPLLLGSLGSLSSPLLANETEIFLGTFEFWPAFLKMALMLAALVGALLLAASLMKRFTLPSLSRYQGSSQIEIVERKILPGKSSIYLLRVGNQEILAAESSDGLRPLAHWSQVSSSKTASSAD